MESPRLLQADIHSNYSIVSGDWVSYRTQITGLYSATGYNASGNATFGDFSDHLIREFNTKVIELGMPTGILIKPYDAGYRLTGVAIS
jgi:hypothetical protein